MYKKVILIGLVLLIAASLVGCGGVAAAQALAPSTQTETTSQTTPRTISVNGNGKVELKPDMASIYIGVHTEGPDAVEAVSSNNEKTQAVIDALIELGVAEEDIQTTNFSIYPQQRYDPQGQPTGEIIYMVDNTVFVKVRDLDSIGAVLDSAVKAGANSINGISFDVEDKSAALSEARAAAVDDAAKQAQELADAAGVEVGQVLSISTTGVTYPPTPIYGKGGGAMAEAAVSVPVSPGQMTITVDVYVVYEIQ
ncbi:MAG: hypothetical protein H6Q38_2008 [Chloroflexi bacterium]|nr:hypothetical protein [Chloroflexota bacterium]